MISLKFQDFAGKKIANRVQKWSTKVANNKQKKWQNGIPKRTLKHSFRQLQETPSRPKEGKRDQDCPEKKYGSPPQKQQNPNRAPTESPRVREL